MPSDIDRETQRVIILGALVNLGLAVMKIIVGFTSNSYALIADGIHSFSDLATDAMVWILNRISVQAPDDNHPYGHARFETFGTLLLGGVLITVAGFIIYQSVDRLTAIAEVSIPTWPALFAAAVSIAANEWLYWIGKRQGEKTRSKLLIANAWHHRSDSLSSIIVLIGVGGAMAGFVWLEMLAAIGVALMIAKIGWDLGRESVEELVDTAQSFEYVAQIENRIIGMEGVRGVHSIRTRRMGPDVIVELHLQVEPSVSVSEGHHVGEWVSRELLTEFDEINDVIFHIDAEDDEHIEKRDEFHDIPPMRREIREALIAAWKDELDPQLIRKFTFHYLVGGVNVELFLSRQVMPKNDPGSELFIARLLQAGKDLPWLRRITVWYD